MDTISIFVNATSIILAIVSLILSLYFFNVSQKKNKESEKIAIDIKNTTYRGFISVANYGTRYFRINKNTMRNVNVITLLNFAIE